MLNVENDADDLMLKSVVKPNNSKSKQNSTLIIDPLVSSSSSYIYPPHSRTYTLPPGLTTQIPVCQMPVGGATFFGPEH